MTSPIVDDHLRSLARAFAHAAAQGLESRELTASELERLTGSPQRYIERIGTHYLADVNELLRPSRIRVRYVTPLDTPAFFHVNRVAIANGARPR